MPPSPPHSVADRIEAYGRMMTAKELASYLALDTKTPYAKGASGTVSGQARMSGSVRWDCYIAADWLRNKAA